MIRGQGTVKLYVIYNVLEVSMNTTNQRILEVELLGLLYILSLPLTMWFFSYPSQYLCKLPNLLGLVYFKHVNFSYQSNYLRYLPLAVKKPNPDKLWIVFFCVYVGVHSTLKICGIINSENNFNLISLSYFCFVLIFFFSFLTNSCTFYNCWV